MICGATIFLLLWLHLDCQSVKIVRKFYLPYPAFSSMLGWWCKRTLKWLVILYLALFNYLSIIIPDQNNLFHIPWSGRECYWSKFYLEVANKQSVHVSHQVIQMMCAIFGDCLLSYMFAKFLCSFCTEIGIPTLKYLASYRGFNSIFYCIMQLQFS